MRSLFAPIFFLVVFLGASVAFGAVHTDVKALDDARAIVRTRSEDGKFEIVETEIYIPLAIINNTKFDSYIGGTIFREPT